MGRYHAEMACLAGGDEKERREEEDEIIAPAEGKSDDQECGW